MFYLMPQMKPSHTRISIHAEITNSRMKCILITDHINWRLEYFNSNGIMLHLEHPCRPINGYNSCRTCKLHQPDAVTRFTFRSKYTDPGAKRHITSSKEFIRQQIHTVVICCICNSCSCCSR